MRNNKKISAHECGNLFFAALCRGIMFVSYHVPNHPKYLMRWM